MRRRDSGYSRIDRVGTSCSRYVLEVVALAGAGRATEAHRVASSVVGDQRFADAPYNPLIFAMPYAGWLSGNLGEVEQYA